MRKKKIKFEGSEVDLTSMIDVCFLLIAFFIMVTEVSKAEVIEIFLPFANNAMEIEEPDDRVIINIDRKGRVFIGQTEFGPPDEMSSKLLIKRKLQSISEEVGFESDKARTSKLTVFLRTDGHARFQYVQCMMMILIDPDVRVTKVHYVAKNPNQPNT